jgi:hypothetical protein
MKNRLRLYRDDVADVDNVVLKILEVNGPASVQMIYKKLHKEVDKNTLVVRLMVMAEYLEIKILPFTNCKGLPDWIVFSYECEVKGTWVKSKVPLDRPFLNDYESENE